MAVTASSYFCLAGCLVPACALWLSGCEGKLSRPTVESTFSGSPPAQGGQAGQGAATVPVEGAWPMRRLTHDEYDNTVADLLADTTRAAQAFPSDPLVHGFDNNVAAVTVPPSLVEAYFDAAERLSAAAVTRLDQLFPCTAGEVACAQTFIQEFGLRAFRRPVTSDEASRLHGLYELGAKRRGYVGGIDLVLRELLFAAPFIFRMEPREQGSATPPDGWAMASRLSYYLWSSAPDAALFEAARQNQLANPTAVLEIASRMLQDPRSRRTLDRFHSQWLGLSELPRLVKDAERYPKWTASTGALLSRELLEFTADAVQGGSPAQALFSASHTFVNAELAAFYGLQPPPTELFERVTYVP